MDLEKLTAALRNKTEALQQQLLAKVEANLSGELLQERSGALKRSIVGAVETTDTGFTASVASTGLAYAAIQEHGGRTAPHDIVPVKAQALTLAGATPGAFARRVRHPGSMLSARAYLGSALEALRGEIETGLKSAVRTALGAD